MLEIVTDVLAMSADALRLLMLSDDLMFERFPRWKESDIARVDKAVQEVIFEKVRAQQFADRPSRIGGIFLFPSAEMAVRFGSDIRKMDGFVLRCSTDKGTHFTADMNLVTSPNPHRTIANEIEQLIAQATKYWAGEMADDAWPEIVVNGEVRIVGREPT